MTLLLTTVSRFWPESPMASSPTRWGKAVARCLLLSPGELQLPPTCAPCFCFHSSATHSQNHKWSTSQFLPLASFFNGSSMDPLDESTVLCIKPQILKMVFKAAHNLAVSWSPQRPCHPLHLFASPMFWLIHTEILTVTQMGYLGLPLCCSLWKKISH